MLKCIERELSIPTYDFIDAHTVLRKDQASFGAGYSTMYHIFVLHALTEHAKNFGKEIVMFIWMFANLRF